MSKQEPKYVLPGLAGKLSRISAALKLLICAGLGIVAGVVSYQFGIKILTASMMGWDVFCLVMLSFSLTIFFTAKADQIRKLAWKNDENRLLIFIVILVTVLISLVAILVLLGNTDTKLTDQKWHVTVSMLGVALSWFMLHTIFTNHYAHLYYGDDEDNPNENKGGLDFPNDEDPDYLDLAYFSFVIGMTFQVSDVTITNRTLRRLVLLHGIISFLFNTIIVALTISLIANLKS